jgi:hypothetical protein
MKTGDVDSYSHVCYGCLGDEYLRNSVRQNGTRTRCYFCFARRKCITIDELSGLVKKVLNENFKPGESWPFYDDDDRFSHYHQDGEELSYIIGEVIEADEPVVEAVIDNLSFVSYSDAKDGVESRYNREINYVSTRPQSYELDWEWDRFRHEIKHQGRFFNDKAKEFLNRLMHEVHFLHVPDEPGETVIHSIAPNDSTVLYRARRIDSPEDLGRILSAFCEELGPPPPERAIAGRMNPEGVSVFYGALDRATCVAELRPSLGSNVVSIAFCLKRSIRVFDFKFLEKSYHKKPLSYFQPDFREKVAHRLFLHRLHAKIREPILPGEEREYLATQVLAEYLATVLTPQVDGILFSSVQLEGGVNIVLFGHALDIQTEIDRTSIMGPNSVLVAVDDSVRVHRISRIEYSFDDRAVKDGEVEGSYLDGIAGEED